MGAHNFSSAPDNTSDATFRAWTSALDAAIAACLTAVSQTGEINFTTVATPNAANQKRGFRIYRMNDAAHATHPCYLRVDYGSGTAATHPSIWVQVGQAVDGSGNLSAAAGGTLVTQQQISAGQAGSATAFDSQVSGDGSRLTFSLWTLWWATTVHPFAFNLERSLDSVGVITDEAVFFAAVSNGLSPKQFTITKVGNVYTNVDRNEGNNDCFTWPITVKTSQTSMAYGLKVGLMALDYWDGWKVYNSPTGFLLYYGADILGNDALTISVYGANKTYYPTGRGATPLVSNNSLVKLAVRND